MAIISWLAAACRHNQPPRPDTHKHPPSAMGKSFCVQRTNLGASSAPERHVHHPAWPCGCAQRCHTPLFSAPKGLKTHGMDVAYPKAVRRKSCPGLLYPSANDGGTPEHTRLRRPPVFGSSNPHPWFRGGCVASASLRWMPACNASHLSSADTPGTCRTRV